MASELPTEQYAAYSIIIDKILATANLETVSAKAIRKQLQAEVKYDLTSQKEAITNLIMERFDKAQKDREASEPNGTAEPAPTTNGAAHSPDMTKQEEEEESSQTPPTHKRKASPSADDDDDDDDLSDVKDTPPPKKAKKTSNRPATAEESDEQMAKRLQAEFARSTTSRSTRNASTNPSSTKKKKTPTTSKPTKKPRSKAKSAAKVSSDLDSDIEGNSPSSPKPEKEKKGGFHKPMHLSEALQELLGESQLSRPQTVKRIWAYVKERDLQDPKDKRQIRCDEKLRRVFKSERVHMFTMNKELSRQLWPVEEVV